MERVQRRYLFVCTGNAGRSQIARALCERQGAAKVYARSAGVEPWEALHPMAVKLLAERGMDISQRRPRHVADAMGEVFDIVVTIGDPARARLPKPMPGSPRVVHWDLSDPADADGTSESEAVFRRTMAAIEQRLPTLMNEAVRSTPSRVCGRPGLTTGMWYPDRFDPAEHLPSAVAIGFAAIELNCFLGVKHFDYHDPQRRRELRRVCDDLGVEVWSIHDPRNPNAIGALDPAARRSAMDDLRRAIDLAAEFGAQAIASHALVHHAYRDANLADLRVGVDALLELAPEVRASGARVAIENTYAGTSAVLPLFAELPSDAFGFVIDTGHANIEGDGAMDSILHAVRGRMCSLHLNDNDGRRDSHHPPGAGTIDWPRLAEGIRSTGYEGCILWEVLARLGGDCDDPEHVMRQTIDMSRRHFGTP